MVGRLAVRIWRARIMYGAWINAFSIDADIRKRTRVIALAAGFFRRFCVKQYTNVTDQAYNQASTKGVRMAEIPPSSLFAAASRSGLYRTYTTIHRDNIREDDMLLLEG